MAVFHYNQERLFRGDPDLHLAYWGREDCAPGHAAGPGVRDHYKVHFIHQGKGLFKVGEATHLLSAGQAFLIYPQVVSYYEADRTEPWSYSWIGFHGAQVESILQKTRLTPEQAVIPMDGHVMPKLVYRLTEIQQAALAPELLIKAALYEFWSAVVEAVPSLSMEQPYAVRQDAYIAETVEFMHVHYCEPLSVEQLSARLGLDRRYFSALFKEAVGVPPQQYLLQYRMQKACELLGTSRCTVTEIARSVGYQDPLLFSKMFKKMRGMSPKEYRARSLSPDIMP